MPKLAAAVAVAIVVGSFLFTLKLEDYWNPPENPWTFPVKPSQEPAYDAASLPHLDIGQTLDFANGQNRNALLSGWSSAEPLGVWTDGRTAFVGFIVDSAKKPTYAVVRGMVYLFAEKLTEQDVQIWSGNSELADYDLKDPNAQLEIPLDKISVANGRPVILGFSLPNASAPSEIEPNHADPRVMALYLKSLQLKQ